MDPAQHKRRRSSEDRRGEPSQQEPEQQQQHHHDEGRAVYEWFLHNLDQPILPVEDEADPDFVLGLPPLTPSELADEAPSAAAAAAADFFQQPQPSPLPVSDEDEEEKALAQQLWVSKREMDRLMEQADADAARAMGKPVRSVPPRRAAVLAAARVAAELPIVPAVSTPPQQKQPQLPPPPPLLQQPSQQQQSMFRGSLFTAGDLAKLRAQFTKHAQLLVQIAVVCQELGKADITLFACKLIKELGENAERTSKYRDLLLGCTREFLGSKAINQSSAFQFPGVEMLKDFAELLSSHPAPANVASAMNRLSVNFRPELRMSVVQIPRVKWLKSEDQLLIAGLEDFDHDWEMIHRRLLPTKAPEQIFNRFKNQTAKSAEDNPIKRHAQESLTPEEQHALFDAVAMLGTDWALISQRFLPKRQPTMLRRFWMANRKTAGGPTTALFSAPPLVPGTLFQRNALPLSALKHSRRNARTTADVQPQQQQQQQPSATTTAAAAPAPSSSLVPSSLLFAAMPPSSSSSAAAAAAAAASAPKLPPEAQPQPFVSPQQLQPQQPHSAPRQKQQPQVPQLNGFEVEELGDDDDD